MTEKPPYVIPTMAQARAVPDNGYHLVSTFTGAGGSCLGYRLAGFRTLWASEFVGAARSVYQLNHPGVPVDPRDIREVRPEDILAAAGVDQGQVDVMEGSPPCAGFSLSGNRERSWGKKVSYSNKRQQVDDLFWEFGRLVKGVRPRAFVAENVAALAAGKAKGYLLRILRMLRNCGYRVECRKLDAQWLGVPQQRERLFFVGMRDDLGIAPAFPAALPHRHLVRDALDGIDAGDEWWPCSELAERYWRMAGHTTTGRFSDVLLRTQGRNAWFQQVRLRRNRVSPTLMQGSRHLFHPDVPRTLSVRELKRIMSFPDDFVLNGSANQNWERLGRAVPPVMSFWVARTVREQLRKADGLEPWPHDLPVLTAMMGGAGG